MAEGVLVVIGIPLLIGLLIFNFIAVIMATVKAANGEQWQYPMTIRFLK